MKVCAIGMIHFMAKAEARKLTLVSQRVFFSVIESPPPQRMENKRVAEVNLLCLSVIGYAFILVKLVQVRNNKAIPKNIHVPTCCIMRRNFGLVFQGIPTNLRTICLKKFRFCPNAQCLSKSNLHSRCIRFQEWRL